MLANTVTLCLTTLKPMFLCSSDIHLFVFVTQAYE